MAKKATNPAGKCTHEKTVWRRGTYYCANCGRLTQCPLCSRYVAEQESTKDIYYDDMHVSFEKPVCDRCETLYITQLFLRLLMHQAIWKRDENVLIYQELLETALKNVGRIPTGEST